MGLDDSQNDNYLSGMTDPLHIWIEHERTSGRKRIQIENGRNRSICDDMEKKQGKPGITEYGYWIVFAAIVGLIIFLSFYKLDVKYVDPWDEARHGVNAYEMLHGGSLIQNTYLRQADYYNLKPPMSMWCIMLSMKLFGDTVFALRCYSAVCYVLLAIAVGLFARRYGRLESLAAMTFLACNSTPFQAHMIRSGDADSLYVLLFTLAMLAMMKVKDNVRYVYACGLLFSLAFLTKSFHAGIILAIGGLYLMITGDIKRMKPKHWAGFLTVVFVPILVWSLLRMRIDGTTFLKAMWETDVLGRTDGTLQNNIAPFSYYFSYYFGASSGKTTVYLCALVICLLGAVLFSQKLAWCNRSEYIGYLLWGMLPFLAFSAVTNKLLWYVYPSLVTLLMAAGIVLAKLMKEKNLLMAVKIALGLAGVCIVVHFVKAEIQVIESQEGNEFQNLICDAAQLSGLQGCRVFVDYDTEHSDWSQQDVFVAQTAGDYECQNGGIMFLLTRDMYCGQEGLLFVGEEAYQAAPALYDDCQIVTQTEEYRAYVISY